MRFDGSSFALFLVVLVLGFWTVASSRTARTVLLLLGSYVFYAAWTPWFLGLLLFSTVLDYCCGAAVHAARSPWIRKLALSASLVGNLGLLAAFKYLDWGLVELQRLLTALGFDVSFTVLGAVVPVGISFYTFQTLSYTIDLYRREIRPARNLLDFALFVGFFPQLLAGPIVRAVEFLPQLDRRPRFDEREIVRGLLRIATGLGQKVVLADSLGRYVVDPVYASPEVLGPVWHVLALYGFAFQLYFDFSGYTNIAIGAAALFGFRLPENFDRPLLARSVNEFWQRWHMTLGRWVRDYLYFPMCGRRPGRFAGRRNLLVCMVLIGLWHGASLHWIVFGLVFGGVMVVELELKRLRGGRPFATTVARATISRIATFHVMVVSCSFVRAESLEQLVAVYSRFGWYELVAAEGLLALAACAAIHAVPRRVLEATRRWVEGRPLPVFGFALGLLVAFVVLLRVGPTPFIYFHF